MRFPANAVVCLSKTELSTTVDTYLGQERRQAYNRGLVAQTSLNLRDRLRRIFLGFVLLLLGTVLLLFCADFLLFRLRVATNRNPYGSVVVSHYYAVLQKNGKTQFIFDPPAAENCVHALFPHSGMKPCWYLSRHPEQRTDI
jgi:hypothetical protein